MIEPEEEPPKPSGLYRAGHVLAALGIVYAPLAYLGSGSAESGGKLAGMIAVPVSLLGLGGVLMFLGRRRD